MYVCVSCISLCLMAIVSATDSGFSQLLWGNLHQMCVGPYSASSHGYILLKFARVKKRRGMCMCVCCMSLCFTSIVILIVVFPQLNAVGQRPLDVCESV